jgi:hypothetical protein
MEENCEKTGKGAGKTSSARLWMKNVGSVSRKFVDLLPKGKFK